MCIIRTRTQLFNTFTNHTLSLSLALVPYICLYTHRERELMSGNFPAHKIVNLSFYTNTFAEIVFRLFVEKNVMTRMIKVSFASSFTVLAFRFPNLV